MPNLTRRIGELRAAHREQWFKTYKPFGWEVLDIRHKCVLTYPDFCMDLA